MKMALTGLALGAALALYGAETRHPWSHLNYQNDAQDFRFAIIPDRGGGDCRGAFTNALRCADLMHPDFVMSVGDLINGFAGSAQGYRRQQGQLTNFVSKVRAPFFYVVGNHDICVNTSSQTNAYELSRAAWHEHFGERTYYSFVYKNCLFVVLDTMDGRDSFKKTVGMSAEQHAWLRQTLAEHKDVRWTCLFLHCPDEWDTAEWKKLETEVLVPRGRYTVFAGDWHTYFHVKRHGFDYYVLSVAGGVSGMAWSHGEKELDKLYGQEYGEMDHITWVTMTANGPEVVNLKLDGILPGDYLNRATSKDDTCLRVMDVPPDPKAVQRCRELKAAKPPKPVNVPKLDAAALKADRGATLRVFQENEYGVRPVERPDSLRFETAADREIMGGRAIHRAVRIHADGPKAPFSFMAHAYLPKGGTKLPSFVLIYLGQRIEKDGFDPYDPEPSRHHFPVDRILSRGYAAVMFNNWDVALDSKTNSFETGVFKAWGPSSDAERTDRDWGAISAWAWGASRVLDWIETQDAFDAKRVAVIGHSRGGKTALWAGATDTRFALACVNDSGCSGAKLNHIDLPKSEHIDVINRNFPHWFCRHYRRFNGKEAEMPFDQHQLVALMAPRAVAIASATLDDWAGQRGEFMSARLATPAWEAYGEKGLVAPRGTPVPDSALQEGRISYHLRTGKHDMGAIDWAHYLDFADKRLK